MALRPEPLHRSPSRFHIQTVCAATNGVHACRKNCNYQAGISTVTAIACSACTGITPVKEVVADKEGYLLKIFSPQTISQSVLKKLPADARAGSWNRMVLAQEATSEEPDGRKETWKRVTTMINKGNGLVMQMAENIRNDIPSSLVYKLTYQGLIDLKWQTLALNAYSTHYRYGIKDMTRFETIPNAVGQEFNAEYALGFERQIANFSDTRNNCRLVRIVPASTLFHSLKGSGSEFECTGTMNIALSHRGKWMLLQDYGVAVLIEWTNTSRKTLYRVTDIKV